MENALDPVMKADDAGVFGAVGATVDVFPGLDSVADDFAAALGTFRRKGMNGAFEAVIVMHIALDDDIQGLVVIVTADFAFHTLKSPNRTGAGAPDGRSGFSWEKGCLFGGCRV